MATQTNFLRDILSGYSQQDLAAIIEGLAGDKDNLRIDLNHVKFCVGDRKFEFNGLVNFKIFRKPPSVDAAVTEAVRKDV